MMFLYSCTEKKDWMPEIKLETLSLFSIGLYLLFFMVFVLKILFKTGFKFFQVFFENIIELVKLLFFHFQGYQKIFQV